MLPIVADATARIGAGTRHPSDDLVMVELRGAGEENDGTLASRWTASARAPTTTEPRPSAPHMTGIALDRGREPLRRVRVRGVAGLGSASTTSPGTSSVSFDVSDGSGGRDGQRPRALRGHPSRSSRGTREASADRPGSPRRGGLPLAAPLSGARLREGDRKDAAIRVRPLRRSTRASPRCRRSTTTTIDEGVRAAGTPGASDERTTSTGTRMRSRTRRSASPECAELPIPQNVSAETPSPDGRFSVATPRS